MSGELNLTQFRDSLDYVYLSTKLINYAYAQWNNEQLLIVCRDKVLTIVIPDLV